MSQVNEAASMLEQSSPSGQQITVVSSATDKQELSLGQQKLSGSPLPHWSKLAGHEAGSARRRCLNHCEAAWRLRRDWDPAVTAWGSLKIGRPGRVCVASAGRGERTQRGMKRTRTPLGCIETASSGQGRCRTSIDSGRLAQTTNATRGRRRRRRFRARRRKGADQKQD